MRYSKAVQSDTVTYNLKKYTKPSLGLDKNLPLKIQHLSGSTKHIVQNNDAAFGKEVGTVITDVNLNLRNSFQAFNRLKCKEEFEFMKLSYRMKKIEFFAWSNFKFDLEQICDVKNIF